MSKHSRWYQVANIHYKELVPCPKVVMDYFNDNSECKSRVIKVERISVGVKHDGKVHRLLTPKRPKSEEKNTSWLRSQMILMIFTYLCLILGYANALIHVQKENLFIWSKMIINKAIAKNIWNPVPSVVFEISNNHFSDKPVFMSFPCFCLILEYANVLIHIQNKNIFIWSKMIINEAIAKNISKSSPTSRVQDLKKTIFR